MQLVPEYLHRAGFFAKAAIGAAVLYGWTRIQTDHVLRADFHTPPAITSSEPDTLAELRMH